MTTQGKNSKKTAVASKSVPASASAKALEAADDDIIRLSDFKSIDLHFQVTNTTTRTEFRDPKAIKVVELGERELTLEVAPRSCSKGHSLMLSIEAKLPNGETLPFSCTARVDESERPDDSALDQIRITLLQFNEEDWECFKQLFAKRQDDILEFFKAAKGY